VWHVVTGGKIRARAVEEGGIVMIAMKRLRGAGTWCNPPKVREIRVKSERENKVGPREGDKG